ncbi:hypothetical protein ABZW18_11785 [Streptomyces sp. NPDC004647]|uniref:hypothetical protein n=1 Tax=Streptomyces sp. NPDC004647 TaxID=3154671 RepID=UPI0033BB65B0
MENLITVAVILATIAAGVLLIHLLNAQHAERIEAFRYSDVLPTRRDRTTKPRRRHRGAPAGELLGPHIGTFRRDHHDAGLGRLRLLRRRMLRTRNRRG